jgi:hypothetical protein
MKKLPLLIACGLGLAGSLMSVSSALAKNDAGNNVHIDQNRQFPETRWASADHYIRIHVPRNSRAMIELRLQITENLKFDIGQVEVFDLQGKTIPAVITEMVSTQNDAPSRSINLAFGSPVASGTQFDIRIKNVKKALISRPSTYFVSAKLAGNNQTQFIGEAYFHSY